MEGTLRWPRTGRAGEAAVFAEPRGPCWARRLLTSLPHPGLCGHSVFSFLVRQGGMKHKRAAPRVAVAGSVRSRIESASHSRLARGQRPRNASCYHFSSSGSQARRVYPPRGGADPVASLCLSLHACRMGFCPPSGVRVFALGLAQEATEAIRLAPLSWVPPSAHCRCPRCGGRGGGR